MNRLTIAASLASTLFACSDDPDIGLDRAPVTCLADQGSSGEFQGHLISRYNIDGGETDARDEFDLGAVKEVSVNRNTNTNEIYGLRMDDGTISLSFSFVCGAPTSDTYDVYPSDQEGQQRPCPLAVLGSAGGQLEYLPTKAGRLVIDENESCFAGRFSVSFGDNGSASGWFSSPK